MSRIRRVGKELGLFAVRQINPGVEPRFIIVGAQKSGTTSLFDAICQHSQVTPALRKEVHYFDMRWHKSLRWYQSHFVPRAREILASDRTSVCGEASPSYLVFPDVAERIQASYPDIKVLMILRDPVARAISHYNHNKRWRPSEEPHSLETAFYLEEDRIGHIDQLQRPWTTDERRDFATYSYKRRGLYSDQIKRFLKVFPRENVKVIKFENFVGNADAVMSDVFEFLGLRPIFTSVKVRNKNNAQKYNISDKILGDLSEYYKDSNNFIEKNFSIKW